MSSKPQSDVINGSTISGMLPHVLVRRAGVPARGFAKLLFQKSGQLIDRYLHLEESCMRAAGMLSVGIARVIGEVATPSISTELMQLRRDIYNDRLPKRNLSSASHELLIQALQPPEQEDLFLWLRNRREREHLLEQGAKALAEDLASRRSILRRLLRNPEFQKGLGLASPSLSYELEQYLQAPVLDSLPRLRRTERSLVRYLSRSVFKLSPFSSFTRTALVEVSRKQAPVNSRARIRRRVTLNRSLVASLARCVAEHPELRGHVPVFMNAFSRNKDGKLMFIQRQDIRSMPARMLIPREAVVTIPESRATMWIVAHLEDGGGSVPLQDLISDLQKSLQSMEQASSYIHKLIDLGFLVHKIPLPDSETSGSEDLRRFLADVPAPIAQAVCRSLEQLEFLAEQFANGDLRQRRDLLKQINNVVAGAFTMLGLDPPPDWNGLVFYEDCIEEPLFITPLRSEWDPAIGDLQQLLSCYGALMDFNLSVRATIEHIVRNEFAGGPVPFLEFVHYFKTAPALPRATGNGARNDYYHTPNPRRLERIDWLAEIRAEMGRVLSECSDTEDLDLQMLAEKYRWMDRVRELGMLPQGHTASFSCYCQPVARDSGAALVINAINEGPYRAFLRTCSSLPEEDRGDVSQAVGRELRQLWRDAEVCELNATYDYNANLHPRATQSTVDCTGASGAESMSIRLHDLALEIDGKERLRVIRRASGAEIVPLDLGMMAVSFAPLTHHILSSVSNSCMIANKPFHPFSWSFNEREKGVYRFPRLVFGRCIARRAGWCVHRENLPHRQKGDTDFSYFLRIRRWQRDLGLPEEVFVSGGTYFEWMEEKNFDRQSWNRRKPQYIHFRNHFLVSILEKIISEVRALLYIEEMLPDQTSWAHWRLHRPVEAVIDCYVAQA